MRLTPRTRSRYARTRVLPMPLYDDVARECARHVAYARLELAPEIPTKVILDEYLDAIEVGR